MNILHRTSNLQGNVSFVVILLLILYSPFLAASLQSQADLEKKIDALTPQDIPVLLQKAHSGDLSAQFMVGQAYYLGKGTATDYSEALKWLRKAAEQGHAPAQFSLFRMYTRGEGVSANNQEALKWLYKAAEGKLASAEFFCGLFFEQIQKDDLEAAKWYRRSAEQGFAPAQAAIGFLYEQGRGVGQDLQESVKWYKKGAEQGNANAQSNLGSMFYEGKGIGKDLNEAAKWFRLSAEQGWAIGQGNLAAMYLSGEGVPQDLVSAYMWCSLAEAAGVNDCKEILRVLESKMKVEEVAEAKSRARAWSQAHPEISKAISQTDNNKEPNQKKASSERSETISRSEATRKDPRAEKLRARAVELVAALENDPLSSKAKGYRKEMEKVMKKEELGVTILICMPVLGEAFSTNPEYSEEWLTQFVYSQVKFLIEHPEKAEDINSVTVAGIEGVLRVYIAMKKAKPKVESNGMELLVQKQQSGLLEDYIKSKGCRR